MPYTFPEAYAASIEVRNGEPDSPGEIGQEEIPVHDCRLAGTHRVHHVVTTTAPSLYFTEPSGALTASLPKKDPV